MIASRMLLPSFLLVLSQEERTDGAGSSWFRFDYM